MEVTGSECVFFVAKFLEIIGKLHSVIPLGR